MNAPNAANTGPAHLPAVISPSPLVGPASRASARTDGAILPRAGRALSSIERMMRLFWRNQNETVNTTPSESALGFVGGVGVPARPLAGDTVSALYLMPVKRMPSLILSPKM